MITDFIKHQCYVAAISKPNQEVCGLIVEDPRGIQTFYECENSHKDPVNNFLISHNELENVKSLCAGNNQRIVAVFHSHCEDLAPGTLTTEDILKSKGWELPYLLYHTVYGHWDYYDPLGLHPYPWRAIETNPKSLEFYLGWQWEWVRSDCYTLVRNLYSGMLGIQLDDFKRPEDPEELLNPEWSLFKVGALSQGFELVETPQQYDLVLRNYDGNFNGHHIGVLIDPECEKYLHLLSPNTVSKVIKYSDRKTVCYLRHPELMKKCLQPSNFMEF